MNDQWLFPLSALYHTPSWEISSASLDYELKERAKGVEFIFRVAAHLNLSINVPSAAAQYLHRFYMRYSVVDYVRQEVAAASLFLATKTEEHSRKLKDIAWICYSKATGEKDENSSEVGRWQRNILAMEEILLEALCFDFIVDHSLADLAEVLLLENTGGGAFEQLAWTLATDSLRTPLSVLQPARVIAAACYILAQRLEEGPNSPSFDERIFSRSSASLPTPPHLYPRSPLVTNSAQSIFQLTDEDMEGLAISIAMILDLYSALGASEAKYAHLLPLGNIPRPSLHPPHQGFYTPDPRVQQVGEHDSGLNEGAFTPASMGRTPRHPEPATTLSDSSASPCNQNTTPLLDPPVQGKVPETIPPQSKPPLDLS